MGFACTLINGICVNNKWDLYSNKWNLHSSCQFNSIESFHLQILCTLYSLDSINSC